MNINDTISARNGQLSGDIVVIMYYIMIINTITTQYGIRLPTISVTLHVLLCNNLTYIYATHSLSPLYLHYNHSQITIANAHSPYISPLFSLSNITSIF